MPDVTGAAGACGIGGSDAGGSGDAGGGPWVMSDGAVVRILATAASAASLVKLGHISLATDPGFCG